jgi:hypothetical protein
VAQLVRDERVPGPALERGDGDGDVVPECPSRFDLATVATILPRRA